MDTFPKVKRLARASVALALGAALVSAVPTASAGPAKRKAAAKPRVVVAVIDSGMNPYHEYFHARGPLYKNSRPSSVTPAVLREFGIRKSNIIEVTRTGDFMKDFAKDRKQFDKIDRGEPYWFKGTNVIGVSFLGEGERLRPDGNASPHGIGTAAAVLTANPDAIVVAVESMSDDSEKWAFTHPAVDIVSTSYGPLTSVPTGAHLSFSHTGVVKNGKAHFGAAANDPSYSTLDETSGPWWSIGIAGFEEGTSGGRQVMSGNVPDFVGDFTQDLPYCRSCETGLENVGGTSFATPRSAGTFSKILLEARQARGHRGGIVDTKEGPALVGGRKSLTVWEMRRALEEAAYYPGTEDFSTEGGVDTAVPVNDAAPWLQTGWGLISPARQYKVVDQTLARLKIRGKATRSKPQEACDFMTANMAARHGYFDRLAARSESFGQSKDPYIYC
jgi:hypothetical protein